MTDHSDLTPTERYELTKLRILVEVQNDLSSWAKQRAWLLVAVIGIVSFFGVGGFISSTVGQAIEKRMETVNAHIGSAVRSSIEAETSARQATRSAESEGRKINDAAANLAATLDKISTGAAKTEEQLSKLSKSLDSRSENVRGESRLLVDALEKRISNIERVIGRVNQSSGGSLRAELDMSIARLEADAKRDRDAYLNNSKYEIQIVFTDRHSSLATKLLKSFRDHGYRAELYPKADWSSIETSWGTKTEFVGSQITVLSPPNNNDVAKGVRELLSTDALLSNIKTGTDKRSLSAAHVGVLIPPGFDQ